MSSPEVRSIERQPQPPGRSSPRVPSSPHLGRSYGQPRVPSQARQVLHDTLRLPWLARASRSHL
jgi:hypothetical protein